MWKLKEKLFQFFDSSALPDVDNEGSIRVRAQEEIMEAEDDEEVTEPSTSASSFVATEESQKEPILHSGNSDMTVDDGQVAGPSTSASSFVAAEEVITEPILHSADSNMLRASSPEIFHSCIDDIPTTSSNALSLNAIKNINSENLPPKSPNTSDEEEQEAGDLTLKTETIGAETELESVLTSGARRLEMQKMKIRQIETVFFATF